MTHTPQAAAQQVDSLIESTAHKIFSQHCDFDSVSALEQGHWHSSLWHRLQQSGLTTVDQPEHLNGSGAHTLDAFNVLRLAGYYAAPVPLAEHYIASKIYQSLSLALPADPVTVIPPQLAQQIRTTPPETSQNSASLVLNGTLKNAPWIKHASTLLIPIAHGNQTLVLFLNRADLTVIHHNSIAGEPCDEIQFEAFQVAPQQIKRCVLTTQQLEQLGALTRSALCWGALEKVLELSVNHALARNQFGRSIAKFQAIQQDLAKLTGEVASASVTIDQAVRVFAQAPEEGSYIAAAKIRAGEAAGLATTIAHQVHGAMGFTNEHLLHHFSRRLWAWRDEYGCESYWSNKLGDYLISAPQPSLWQWTTKQ